MQKEMPSARIELAILSLHTEVVLVIRFTTKPRGPEVGIPTLLDWLVESLGKNFGKYPHSIAVRAGL
jgi:hypothetical protein